VNRLPETLTLPPRTIIRPQAADDFLTEAVSFGSNGIIVHGRSLGQTGRLQSLQASASRTTRILPWPHPGAEPTLDELEKLLSVARRHHAQWVAGIGGGSTLDLAKACAGLLHADQPVQAYHDGAPLPAHGVPFIAAPTTAGAGSEATAVCVLTNTRTGVKKSFRSTTLLARVVLLDPTLLASCPRTVIACAGMDAFTQAFESFVSRGASALTDSLALQALRQISGSLEIFHQNPSDTQAAQAMLEGSYLAGIALSHARLGVVHGLAHPLGARFHQPHGLVCAVCLPPAITFNRPVCADKYAQLETLLNMPVEQRVLELMTRLDICNPLKGQHVTDLDAFVKEVLDSGSTAANPRPVTPADVRQILAAVCG